jgi:2,4-dienoyl-CoA reductase-like NADH-dependent reductase (Old Yellow Enzyme family)
MTLQYGRDGLISDRHVAFYRERARGGLALQFSEQLTASPLSDSPFGNAIAAFDERQVERFAAIARALEPFGTRFFAQLFAAGAVGNSTVGLERWGPVRGPSRVSGPGGETPAPLEVEELNQVVADFARSAAHVKAGSLHGVEVHGSHGWLVGQFLSPFYNRREDEYGGSVANRCRLALEIGAAIRTEVGPDFPLGLSLTYDEMIGDAGITPEDTLAQLAVFAAAGVYDFFDLSIGSRHAGHFTIAPMNVEEGFALPFSARAKAVVAEGAAIFVAGRVVDPLMAAVAIADGKADMVAMSRAHLADPHLLRKARTGELRRITRCIGVNTCVGRALRNEPVTCVLNPVTGREAQWGEGTLVPVPEGEARRVVVVGAGPAGLRVGATAAARGHDVVVHERNGEPGGHLRDVAWLPSRGAWARAIEDLVTALESSGGALVLNSDLGPDQLERDAPDTVLVAAGADWDALGASSTRPNRAQIPGIETGNVLALDVALRTARQDRGSLGRRVLIFDETGTYPPLGLAEALAAAGARVEIVTPGGTLGAVASVDLELPHVLPRLRVLDVVLTTGHHIEDVEGSTVRLGDTWGSTRTTREADSIVLAVGRVPRDEIYHALRGRLPDVRCLGDALAPRTTAAVIHEAEAVARELELPAGVLGIG